MAWLRRRRAKPALIAPSTEIDMVPRVERALMMLAAHAQQIEDRLVRIEERVDHVVLSSVDVATQADVMEMRVHSARVAADLARLEHELRGDIERAASGTLSPARNACAPSPSRSPTSPTASTNGRRFSPSSPPTSTRPTANPTISPPLPDPSTLESRVPAAAPHGGFQQTAARIWSYAVGAVVVVVLAVPAAERSRARRMSSTPSWIFV